MPVPLFDFFEIIADELSVKPSTVITHDSLKVGGNDSALLLSLLKNLRVQAREELIPSVVNKLADHFKEKNASLPFNFDPQTCRFDLTNQDFIDFVNQMKDLRSDGTESKVFEKNITERLSQRVTGVVHRVGHPREHKRRRSEFDNYLTTLGFLKPTAYGKDKDCGLDILWLLPFGTIPYTPIVSVQCKNSEFNIDDGRLSLAISDETFSRHSAMQKTVYVPCVVFNDYITPERLGKRPMGFVPLGLSDLASLTTNISVEYL